MVPGPEGSHPPPRGTEVICASSASTPPRTPTTSGPSTAPCSAPASTATPGPRTSPSTSSTTTHPATAHLAGQSQSQWHWKDEVYLFADLRPDARVLLRLADDQVDLTAPGGRVPDCGFPLAWTVEDGPARTFYSALGHFPQAWETPAYLQHLAGGLAWLAETA